MNRVYRYILPEVGSQLSSWREAASAIPDPELKKQAIASMTSKRFHCEGGAVYAAANLPQRHILIPLIVALQTISDYLDNLCDRSTSLDEADFRRLHQAMLDAVDPAASLHDYYAFHGEKDDGGYLDRLVKTCQSCICMLPSYAFVQEQVTEWVRLYCDLQVYKHIRLDLREAKLLEWWERYRPQYPELLWNEFAAATGSTLGVFNLFLASSDKFLTEDAVQRIRTAYFPYLCSLHILLDYLIDMDEDKRGGDLNFCSYYSGPEETEARIGMIADEARRRVGALDHPRFHRMVIEGLLALYLSDPKVKNQRKVKKISRRLMRNSPLTRLFFWINSLWIRRMNSDPADSEIKISLERNG
ncbi:tetraprenyl-beta-curcumene synthase family protein [Ferviditalea candida]|uniref:Tetraprenyl-beta-curcumene synthase family protein n=1 Tax=Ferviditalea candida TaxID=3108399 RepID=A0ABU5ZCN2_9BACL|nr:tetraprenyl-beta-curcumene synthase family protein [Paenibacillaceae bacterium T2]